jgi:hypothetical protein
VGRIGKCGRGVEYEGEIAAKLAEGTKSFFETMKYSKDTKKGKKRTAAVLEVTCWNFKLRITPFGGMLR